MTDFSTRLVNTSIQRGRSAGKTKYLIEQLVRNEEHDNIVLLSPGNLDDVRRRVQTELDAQGIEAEVTHTKGGVRINKIGKLVKTSCVGVCTLNERGICVGCFRTIAEIEENGRTMRKVRK